MMFQYLFRYSDDFLIRQVNPDKSCSVHVRTHQSLFARSRVDHFTIINMKTLDPPTSMKPIECGWAGARRPRLGGGPSADRGDASTVVGYLPQLGPPAIERLGIGWLRCKNWSFLIVGQHMLVVRTFGRRFGMKESTCVSVL